jgi:hypothetical protein
MLFAWLVPQGAWALDTVNLKGKNYYVLRNSNDWIQFRDLVDSSNGKEVNAIMDADFSIQNSIALNNGVYYNGTFNGNGHTLNVNISGGFTAVAPFMKVNHATIKNLHVTGKVSGDDYVSGLIGTTSSSGNPRVDILCVWVSATADTNLSHASGFVGLATKNSRINMENCRSDGYLSSSDYKIAFAYWEGGAGLSYNYLYEKCTANNNTHFGFNYYKSSSSGEVYPYAAYEYESAYYVYSAHNWNEMPTDDHRKVTDENLLMARMNSTYWKMYDGKAVPLGSYPMDIRFETYDMVLGTAKGEEGMLKIPFSSDEPVYWIGGTYTDENGATKTINESFNDNTYAGFIKVPATVLHKNMKLNVKLSNGYTILGHEVKNDMTMHKVQNLTATTLKFSTHNVLTDAGAVELKWTVSNADYQDAVDGDQFLVMRTITGNTADAKNIGSVMFEKGVANYTFKDSLITSEMTEAQIQAGGIAPYYIVVRASAKELWGLTDNVTSATASQHIDNLHLLKVSTGYMADWKDQTARTISVKWNYGTENGAVWNSQAQMKLILTSANRNNESVDTTIYVLTTEEIQACKKELTLTHSCVYYNLAFITELGSIFGYYKSGEQSMAKNIAIYNTADWNTFVNMVKESQGEYGVNAWLMADISISTQAGVGNKTPYRGTFEGNGHTLTCSITGNNVLTAPFSQVSNATIRNLHINGSISSGRKYTAGLVGIVQLNGSLSVTNCRVSAEINSTISGEATNGGFVGQVQGSIVNMRNCLFDGLFTGDNCHSNGGFIGNILSGGDVVIQNSLFSPAAIRTKFDNCATWARHGTAGKLTLDNSYCTKEYAQGTPPGDAYDMSANEIIAMFAEGWAKGFEDMPLPTTSTVQPPSSDVSYGLFYYENLGHIAKQSLETETRPSSVLLTWENETDEPVDYYEVWRKDKNDANFGTKPLATQITDMQYEDKATSPVHQYIYKVRGVTSCEGISYDETKEVEGMCYQTASVEGYLRFLDGTGIPGMTIVTTLPDGKEKKDTTNESGRFRLSDLPYVNAASTVYQFTAMGINGLTPLTIEFGTHPGDNVVTGQAIEVGESVKLSGFVTYDGTSIPVQGASFLVDGYEVKNAAGPVTTDHEGKFSFRILKGKHKSIQAVKDGHKFWRDGFYHENDDDPDTQTAYDIQTDKAGLLFYDQTRVKLIGRVVGGNTQGELPLGYALSKNNLGDNLQMVFTLEGDNSSRLVFDKQDRNLKERDEVFRHEAACKVDSKHKYQTTVHTTLNRLVVSPDPYTGEYEVLLPPVKWKIQQITAKGYATLFQDGQVGDVIDLSDSIVMHSDTLRGEWKTSGDHTVMKTVVEEYQAKYSRIYHSPVLIEYKQQGFSKFNFFGDQYYSFKNLAGSKQKLTLAYETSDGETAYTFGHPVFSIDKKYPLWISAAEKYYYNNNMKSDTIDVVSLPGGVVTIHNGMVDALHRDTVQLDSLGHADYVMQIAQKPYLLTGDDALQTMTMTLLQDGTYYEAVPLKGYVFNIMQPTGAQDILSCEQPLLLDILRDPPGGSSHATMSKGATLKRAYTMDMEWKAGLEINLGAGFKFKTSVGIVAAPMGVGASTSQGIEVEVGAETKMNLVVSGSGERAFEYTMTTTEDISTSSDPKLVGADGDLYIGTVQNIEVKPGTAIRAIPDSTFQRSGGELESGRMVEIARGVDHEGYPLHLVREEVLTYGATLRSNFVHSQHYIIHQLIPQLTAQCQSLMFTGTKEEAQTQANVSGKPVYWSMVGRDSEDFGVNYEVVYPKNYSKPFTDEALQYHESMKGWMEMIARNEKEKLDATDLVANYDVDGGTTINYSESFSSDYSLMNSFVSPFTPIKDGYFDNGLANAAVIVGTMAARLLGLSAGSGFSLKASGMGANVEVKLSPVASFDVTPKHTESSSYSRTESFSVSMDKKSHLDFDVYRATAQPSQAIPAFTTDDIFLSQDFWQQRAYVNAYLDREFKTSEFSYPHSFVYRTRGGATCRPYEGERKTVFNRAGTVLDVRTKKIENPKIAMDKQSVSGVPYGEPARFKLYLTNESEQPEAAYAYFDLYQVDMKNPDGARLMIDGMPLTGTSRTIEVRPGQVTEKTLEVYAGEKFDYEGLQIGIISQGDVDCYAEVAFDVHYLQTAGSVAILTPGDKWVLNCDAPQEQGKGWYLPVTIGGFDKNQHNFDHIEFQYKETTRGDDYWTNLCGYYADSTLYRAASGTKEMIPVNGNIQTRFFGEGEEMEKAYDLRAVLFCRNGNGFLTNESKVLSGVKDTRRPKLFGSPEPKSGIVGAGDNIVFNFSEDIEYNYLQPTTNFEVTGETNETSVQEAPSLQFGGNGYAQTQSRRNFAGKNLTVEVMVKTEAKGSDMPIFSHGSEGKQLQLWLTKERHLKAVVDGQTLESTAALDTVGFQRVALVLDNDNKRLMLYGDQQMGRMDSVTYSGAGPLTFGAADESGTTKYFTGRMLQGRLWYRAMDLTGLNRYGGKQLTGYELGLVDYYPMNDGRGTYASDLAQGAHLTLDGASWAQPEGMSLKLDPTGDPNALKKISIREAGDWTKFTQMVTKANGQYDVNATLMTDLTVTVPAAKEVAYRGIFEGNGHTVTCNIKNDGDQGAGLFAVVGNATIRNLRTAGTVSSTAKNMGALIATIADDATVTVERCHVSARLVSSVSGKAAMGGIVGNAAKCKQLTISDCMFDGSFEGENAKGNGGFVGWMEDYGQVQIKNGLFAPTDIKTKFDDCTTWVCAANADKVTVSNSHATKEYKMVPISFDEDGNFIIYTAEDWNTFTTMVEEAKGKKDVNAVLNADITVDRTVGTGEFSPYRGIFDGNGHTISMNIESEKSGACGLFSSAVGYTIKNLRVTGTIKGKSHTAGLIGNSDYLSDKQNTISNCHISARVDGSFLFMGGIIAHGNGHENITNCLFDGSVSGGISSGAIIGYLDNKNNVQVHNCLEKGTYNSSISNMSFDDRSGIGNNGSSFTNNWSYQNWSEMNGNVVGSMPVAELVEKLGSDNWHVLDGEAVPIMHSKDILLVYEIASGDVAGKSADEIMALLGGNWTKDANGSAVPYFTTTDLGEQVKTYGLKLRSDLFQRDDEQDYTLMFWFKTAQENGTLLANGAGKANDEGALHKFFIGFEDATLKYRTNGREFELGDNLCDDGWHHYAMTVNRARNVASIYIDNVAKAQLTTDSLGGMLGNRFYLGDMVWQEKGNPAIMEENPFTGHIDGLMLFEQALPTTLIRRYSEKSPGGEERGLLLHMPFDHQEQQKNGNITLQPLALSTRVKRDNDGIDTGKRDSVFVDPVDDITARIDRTMGAPVAAYEHLHNLLFSYVGRDNLVLVNIDEQDARINKQNVYVTLYDIPDKNGNFMKSPATECFYVNRNPLTWMSLGKHRNVTVQQGKSLTLSGVILNSGGKAHTYTIENIPRWITADKTSDIVQPQGEDEVTFTISPNLEVGTYDQMIYLTDEDGMTDAYYLELTVEGKAPEWKVDPSMMRYSMNIVAQVFINNTLVTDSHDKVAAFDANGRCMGVNNIEYDAATGQSMLYMTVYDSTTVARQLSFCLWHYATGKTMQLTPSQLINFGSKAIVGTVDKPVKMIAENMYQQTIDLAQGWNWMSFNVYNENFVTLKSVLSRFQWQEGDILTEDSEGLTLVYKKGQWISTTGSDIEDLRLSQKVSYSVLVQNDHQIDIWGTAYMNAEQRTMTVKPGWSSIGYTPLVNLPVTTALTEYFDEATPGDVVKNQHEFAMFTADGKGGGKWQGTLKYMKPGEGYMIHRQKQTTATFTYPYYEPGENFFETTVAYAPQYAPARFATTMSVVAEAVGVELQEGDRLIAFAGGEVVGESLIPSPSPIGEGSIYFLSIEGEQQVPLTFAIERGDDIIATTDEVMTYEVNGISGTVDEPTKISFVTTDQLPQTGWYTVSGMKLQKRPTQSGVYIFNGKKIVVK